MAFSTTLLGIVHSMAHKTATAPDRKTIGSKNIFCLQNKAV